MRILFKYASRGRPEKFMAGLDNIYSTVKTQDFLILCSLDKSDKTMNGEKIRAELNSKPNLVYYYGDDEGKVGAINRDMDKVENDPWQLLINFSDDMRFSGYGWDEVMLRIIKYYWPEREDFFLHLHDGYVPKDTPLPTMSIMDRVYYNRDKYIYHPSYKSFSCDAEAMFVALMRGRHKYVIIKERDREYSNQYHDRCLFKHEHPAWNQAVASDKIYQINAEQGAGDTDNYVKRMKNNFDISDANPRTIYFDSVIGITRTIPDENYFITPDAN